MKLMPLHIYLGALNDSENSGTIPGWKLHDEAYV